jgi:hypothetical protein
MAIAYDLARQRRAAVMPLESCLWNLLDNQQTLGHEWVRLRSEWVLAHLMSSKQFNYACYVSG